ncbi:F-actin-monooxygenase mical2-like isoform X2 [Narcine bancroftii]|uniref:F-actin-monooxygenase mical2-like isoform X2 n=1 Tax=Narcine bancroftii TaxID=1343680 RepID=UPI0038316407
MKESWISLSTSSAPTPGSARHGRANSHRCSSCFRARRDECQSELRGQEFCWQVMGDNDGDKGGQSSQFFENFVQASTFRGTLQAFHILCRQLDLDPLDHRMFYPTLRSKLNTWRAKALWSKLDKQSSHKEYKQGSACPNTQGGWKLEPPRENPRRHGENIQTPCRQHGIRTQCLIVGAGPCGLRTSIELALLGCKVLVLEKRESFARNNVLHLWPSTIQDLRALGAKDFYGKFCAGAIDHISIRQLQLILVKVALLLGVEVHVNVEFVQLLEPPQDQETHNTGWRAEVQPQGHPVSQFNFDVIIGADGRKSSLQGFRRKEFRGKLAIAITANFINRNTTAEAKVEEISGVAFIFNQKFFQDLKEETGIDLENIVYYKDNTHYFVMTAKKQSLLDKGVIANDYVDTEMLLGAENVNQEALLSYAREAADFATNYQLPALDFALNHNDQPDVAMFDFTCMYASENASLARERWDHRLLVALVGDSLLEPFWPMGTGCARGFLAALDTAWMVKRWAEEVPTLEVLAERESIYRLLPQTTPENISKNFEQYTIDPASRYPNLNSNCVQPHQVRQLYITTDLKNCPLERVNSIRKSIKVSRRDSEIRPNRLLTWCQKQTESYQNVVITDLSSSWRSGLALCAIIHHFCPHLIDFNSLNEEDAAKNNQLAFDIAEREFGISPVTTGKEMASVMEPDKLSMVMYLSKFYEHFRGNAFSAASAAMRLRKEGGDDASVLPGRHANSLCNVINLLPRKRTPKEKKSEDKDTMSKRRKKAMTCWQEAVNPKRDGDQAREPLNQNKVKSMANQLLAKFEENAASTSLQRQPPVLSQGHLPSCLLRPSPLVPPECPVNPRFLKPQDQTRVGLCMGPRQSDLAASAEQVIREAKCTRRAAGQPDGLAGTPRSALVISGVLQRLQRLEEKLDQRKALSLAQGDIPFSRKSIKERGVHLTALFGGRTLRQQIRDIREAALNLERMFLSGKEESRVQDKGRAEMTVGKVSSVIGEMAEVLVTLYRTDHRPKAAVTCPKQGSLRKEFPQNVGGSDICFFCKKRVYVVERLSADGKFFHRECFKCDYCATTLRLGVYAFNVEEGKFYCKPHFSGSKGINKARKRRNLPSTLTHKEGEAVPLREMDSEPGTDMASACTVSSTADVPPVSQLQPESIHSKRSKCKTGNVDLPRTSPALEGHSPLGSPQVLAVRVKVTSDGSSSETESEPAISDFTSSPGPGTWGRRTTMPQRKAGTKSGQHNVTSKAQQALSRALSLNAPAKERQERWREKIRRKLPVLLGNKMEGPVKEGNVDVPASSVDQDPGAQLRPNLTRGHSLPTRSPRQQGTAAVLEAASTAAPPQPGTSVRPQRFTRRMQLPPVCQSPRTIHKLSSWSSRGPAEAREGHPVDSHYHAKLTEKLTDGPLPELRDPSEKGVGQTSLATRGGESGVGRSIHSPTPPSNPLGGIAAATSHGSTEAEKNVQNDGKAAETRVPASIQTTISMNLDECCPSDLPPIEHTHTKSPSLESPKSPLSFLVNAFRKSLLESRRSTLSHAVEQGQGRRVKTKWPRTFSISSFHGLSPVYTSAPNVPLREDHWPRPVRSQTSTLRQDIGATSPPHQGDLAGFLLPCTSADGSGRNSGDDQQQSNTGEMERGDERCSGRSIWLKKGWVNDHSRKNKGLISSVTMGNPNHGTSKNPIPATDDTRDRTPKGDIWRLITSFKRKRRTMPRPFTSTRMSTLQAASQLNILPGFDGQLVVSQTREDESESSLDDPSEDKEEEGGRRKRKLKNIALQKVKQEELKRLHRAQIIQRQLQEVEEKQRVLEERGVLMEKVLRGESELDSKEEPQLMQKWFRLVMEKNVLVCYEAELMIFAQELELEDHQSRLQQLLRSRMEVKDFQKTEEEIAEEQRILSEILEVMEQREKLVSLLEEQRRQEKEENQDLESWIVAKGYKINWS